MTRKKHLAFWNIVAKQCTEIKEGNWHVEFSNVCLHIATNARNFTVVENFCDIMSAKICVENFLFLFF